MAFESTAINELVAGIQQKPLERDSSDWLFGEGDEPTEIDPRGAEVRLFEPDPRVVSLPRPYVEMPAYAVEHAYHRARSATTHVHAIDWSGIAKKLALPIALVSIVSVALAVYFAKADEAPAKASAAVASESTAASIEDVKLEVTAEAVAVPAEPTAAVETAEPVEAAPDTEAATPVEPAPAATAMTPAANVAAPAANAATPAANTATPVAIAAAPAANVAAPAVKATTPAAAPAAAEAVKVEPGSPASRFLAPPRVETTIRTAVKPAPAPTAVAGLVAPAAAPSAPAAAPAAEPVAKVAVTPVAKKSARQLRAEKRAAAKRAKRVAKVRAKKPTKRVAVATNDAADARPTGKGILSIASTPSMQVWVDGRNSKAMTPVRIKLLAGTHKVTLLDNGRGKSRSFSVVVKPDETVKITKNYE